MLEAQRIPTGATPRHAGRKMAKTKDEKRTLKTAGEARPWRPRALQGAWVWPLVGDLGPLTPHDATKHTHTKKKQGKSNKLHTKAGFSAETAGRKETALHSKRWEGKPTPTQEYFSWQDSHSDMMERLKVSQHHQTSFIRDAQEVSLSKKNKNKNSSYNQKLENYERKTLIGKANTH